MQIVGYLPNIQRNRLFAFFGTSPSEVFATMYQKARHQIQEYGDSECYQPKKQLFLIFPFLSSNLRSSLVVCIYFPASNVSVVEVTGKELGNFNLVW